MLPAIRSDATPARQEPTVLEIIAAAANDASVDVAKMQALFALKRQIDEEDAKRAFFAAFRLACEEMQPVVKDAENSHTGSKYALLETIDSAIRPIYTKHGFSMSFNNPLVNDGGVTVSCTVFHSAGWSKDYQATGALDSAGAKGTSNKTPIQAFVSTTSYLRRCLECLIWNVVLRGQDKDGNDTRKLATITQEQGDNLESLIAELGMDAGAVSNFLRIMEAKTLREIKADRYRQATMMLEARRGRTK